MTKAFRLIASTGIHKGDREYQQDQVALISHERHNGCVLGVVADGMGGRSGGRIHAITASRVVRHIAVISRRGARQSLRAIIVAVFCGERDHGVREETAAALCV